MRISRVYTFSLTGEEYDNLRKILLLFHNSTMKVDSEIRDRLVELAGKMYSELVLTEMEPLR